MLGWLIGHNQPALLERRTVTQVNAGCAALFHCHCHGFNATVSSEPQTHHESELGKYSFGAGSDVLSLKCCVTLFLSRSDLKHERHHGADVHNDGLHRHEKL